MARKFKSRSSHSISLMWSGLFILALICIFFFFHTRNQPTITKTPTATINSLPTHLTPNSGTKSNSESTQFNEGTSTDNQGQSTTTPPQSSQWSQSESGLITVKSPTINSTFKNGGEVAGSSSLSQVQFRLIDDQVGVIDQGSLSVVNGTFSGNLGFSPSGDTGRLDVFSLTSSGKEVNEVQIPLRF